MEEGLSTTPTALEESPAATLSDHPGGAALQPLTGVKLWILVSALVVSDFLNALDQTILSAAIPSISDDFHALSDVSWYASAYLLLSTAFMPLQGQIYAKFDNLKLLYIANFALFEVGSILCAAAPSSKVFILGRAIAGIGAGGVYIGIMRILSRCFTVRQQSTIVSFVMAGYGSGLALGPLLGGAFTTKVSWRWCFAINVPIGVVVLLVAIFLLHVPQDPDVRPPSVLKRLSQLDFAGLVIILGSLLCIILGLQDGGISAPWSSSLPIGLIVGSVALAAAFILLQHYRPSTASVPLRLFHDRNVVLCFALNFTIGAGYFILLTYLPIYFQIEKGYTPLASGVATLPFVAGIVVFGVVSGVVVSSTGHFHPPLILGSAVVLISSALTTIFSESTSKAAWASIELVGGIGIGTILNQPYIASQIFLAKDDLAQGSAVLIALQTLGGALGTIASAAMYQNILQTNLKKISGLDVAGVLAGGLTTFRTSVPAALLPAAVEAATTAMRPTFILAAVLAGCTLLFSLVVEWRRIGEDTKEPSADAVDSEKV